MAGTSTLDFDTVECEAETCHRTFNSRKGMKIHHAKEHGERIVDTRECEECDGEYEPESDTQKYCSSGCRVESQREQVELTCPNCDDEFSVKPSAADDRTYCSMDCRSEHGKISLTCDQCDETFTTYRSRSDTARFCSAACKRTYGNQASAQLTRDRVTLTCEVCEAEFERKRSEARTARFCSYECKGRYRGRQSGAGCETRCEVCCATFSVRPSRADSARFCSRRCYRRGMRRTAFRPRPYHDESEFEKLVRKTYLYDALTIDETYRVVQTKLSDGEQYTREDVEEYTGELLETQRSTEIRLRNMYPEDLGLTPIGGDR